MSIYEVYIQVNDSIFAVGCCNLYRIRTRLRETRLSLAPLTCRDKSSYLISLGTLAGRVVVITHTPRGRHVTRIISMRKANPREQKTYDQERSEATGPHDG